MFSLLAVSGGGVGGGKFVLSVMVGDTTGVDVFSNEREMRKGWTHPRQKT